MRRWRAVLVLAVAAAGLLAAAGPAAGEDVELVDVDHPGEVVYNRTYRVSATVANPGDEDRKIRLFSALYEPDGSPCGPASGDDYHGTASTRDVPLDVPAGGTATYPDGDAATPWWHRVNASNDVSEGGRYEVCTFAYDPTENTSRERFQDVHVRNVTLRMTNEPPEGSASVDPEVGTTETVFRFTAEATDPEGDEVSYAWDFNDVTHKGRATAEGREATHEFYPEGRYTVNLTLSDGWDERVVQVQVDVYPVGELPVEGGGIPAAGPAAVAGALGAAAAAGRRFT